MRAAVGPSNDSDVIPNTNHTAASCKPVDTLLDSTPAADATPPDPRSEIRLYDAAAVFFASIFTAGIGIAVGIAVGGDESYAATIGSLVGLWAGLVPGTVLVCRLRGTGDLSKDLGLRFERPGDLWGVLVGLASQFVALPLVYFVIQAFSARDLSEDLEKPARELTDNAHGAGFFVLAVLLVVGAPLVEELFYRGMLLRSLNRHMPPIAAVVVSGVCFGAAHFNLLTLPGLALFGVILGYLAQRYGRLGPGIIAHAAFNAVTVVLLWNA